MLGPVSKQWTNDPNKTIRLRVDKMSVTGVRKSTGAGVPTDSRKKREASPHTPYCFLVIGWFKAQHAALVPGSGLSHTHHQSPH